MNDPVHDGLVRDLEADWVRSQEEPARAPARAGRQTPPPERCSACAGRGDLTRHGPFGTPLESYRRCEACLGTGWADGKVRT